MKEITVPRLVPKSFGKVIDLAAAEHRVYLVSDRHELYNWGEEPSPEKKLQDEFFIINKTNA